MPRWFNYWPLHPLLNSYDDEGSSDLFVIPVDVEGVGRFEAAAIGVGSAITMIRVATLDSDGKLTPTQQEALQTIKAHLLAVLRLTYDIDIQLAHRMGTFMAIGTPDVAEKPNLHIRLHVPQDNKAMNWNNVKNVFMGSTAIRPLMILIADMQDGALPVQYRYLSLYKAFELEFKSGAGWSGLKEILNNVEPEYIRLGISQKKLLSLFHDLRDRCAHIKTGNKERLGLVGLPDKELQVVESLLPLLVKVLIGHVNTKYMPLHFACR